MARARLSLALTLAIVVLVASGVLGATSCLPGAVRRPQSTADRGLPDRLRFAWQTPLHPRVGLAVGGHREECASGVLVDGNLVIGTRAGAAHAVDTATGRVRWTHALSGSVDGRAVFDKVRRQVLVGADDGVLFALDPTTGEERWHYKAKGSIDQPPEIGADRLFVATAADRVLALEAATGKWLWQYERETPPDFTIHGYAAPRLVATNRVLAGFSDGYLVSLRTDNGEVAWARSLAAASDQFVDVDSTPALAGDTVYAASHSGGLYALAPDDGAVRWRLGVDGVGTVRFAGEHLYFAAAREGVHAADREGRVLWRQALPEAGDLQAPVVVGPYLLLSGSRQGLFLIERDTGRLLQVFNRGEGVCGAPTVDAASGRVFVLANGGTLYAFDLG